MTARGAATLPPAARVPWPAVVRRAALLAVAIGAALALVNQGSALFGDATLQTAPLGLGFATPFVVIALSQVLGHRAYWRRAAVDHGREEALWLTAAGHGIPARALVVAAVVGSLLTPLVIALSSGAAAGGEATPWAQIAQLYTLPLVFGILSQSLAFRRARAADRTAPGRPPARRVSDLVDAVYSRPH